MAVASTEWAHCAMVDESVSGLFEALIFAAGDPVETAVLAKAAEISPEEAREVLRQMQTAYQDVKRGLRLTCVGDAWQLSTKTDYGDAVFRALSLPQRNVLSHAALETLAIIAYRQPITRVRIEEIRGVSCSHTIGLLMDRGLIEEAGRLNVVGNPFLYRTTPLFLQAVGIEQIEALEDFETFVKKENEGNAQ